MLGPMLEFGVTVLPDPPYQRLIELTKLAEAQGFDVRLDVRLARALAGVDAGDGAPRRPDLDDQARPHGHEPGHSRSDGARERLRNAAGHLERPDDHGRRPRRLVGAVRGPQADEGRRLRGSAEDGEAVHERQGGHLERQAAPAQVGSAGTARDRDARRRLRAEGARRRRPAGGRRHHPARRPGHHPVDHGDCPPGRRRGRARPGRAQVHRQRAEPHLGRPGRRARAGALVPGDGVEPRPGPDRPLRHRRLRRAARC